jgi:hypothetical protein
MSCFNGIVSLKGCSVTETPGSVYSLNSLPGISLKAFEDIANEEQKNYVGVWDNINERAEARIKNAILSYMATKYNIKRVQRTVDTYNVATTLQSESNIFQGIVINNSWDWVNNYVKSPFQNISIDKIRVFYDATSTATTIDIKFVNYVTKDVFLTKRIDVTTLVAGWNEVSILKTFDTPILAIGFNTNNYNTVTYDSNKVSDWYSDCICACYDWANCGYIKGFVSSDATKDGEFTYQQNIVGLQAVLTIGCSYDAALCTNRLLFAEAFWYLLGSEFMTESIYSPRINFMTTVKKDEAVELKAHYDLQFEEALKNALNGLRFDCDECLQCNSLVQTFTQLP